MKTIVLTDYAWPDNRIEREIIESAGHRFVSGPPLAGDTAAIETLVAATQPHGILTCWAPVSAAAIASARDLSIIARMGVGIDNIAMGAATAAGVWVTNVPDYCVEEVSDHAVALIFAWARGIAGFDAQVKAGAWNPAAARLRRLANMTAGILGYGRIGRATARKLRGVGISVLAYDAGSSAYEDGVEHVSRNELLRRSDIVVLHLPLTPDTHHFMNSETLGMMKPGAFLVNVSRGPIVDSNALIAALESARISGAGIDVVEGEPDPPADLVRRRDVIATPHVAFSSDAAVAELRTRAAEEVVRALADRTPQYPCNRPSQPARK